MAAVIMSLANAQSTHPSHLHRWSERSIAAYLEHKEAFRAPRATRAQEQGHDNSASYWNQFRPAFVCPWQDRIGRISEGGKWLCNWQVVLEECMQNSLLKSTLIFVFYLRLNNQYLHSVSGSIEYLLTL